VIQQAIRTSSSDGAPGAAQVVSPWWCRTRWLQPSAANLGENVPVKVTLSNYVQHGVPVDGAVMKA